ncbi:MAG: FlgD immunoglobulin-like domain containing protein [Candidatus Thorarchaeota archaeon]
MDGGGGVDKFRIKIWDKDVSDAVVYDNQLDDADDVEATDAIEGGSIVIHDKGQSKIAGNLDQSEEFGLSSLPEDYALSQNYPNPFNPETEIYFQLPETNHVVVAIFNTRGQEIRRLADGNYEAGYHSLNWNGMGNQGNPVASGVYLYQLRTPTFSHVRKMSLMR